MIKAIIFDCFGVLTTEGFKLFNEQHFKDSPEKRLQAQEIMNESNLGHITYRELVKQLSELAKVSPLVIDDYLSDNKPNEPLFNYIREVLKPKYKIGMLSNSSANWLSGLFSAKDLTLFDDVILSFAVGLTKPDPKIYQLAASRLQTNISECILIDDIGRFCEGAAKAGMWAILYKDFDQVKTELEEMLATESNN